jgi:hypothetical protein
MLRCEGDDDVDETLYFVAITRNVTATKATLRRTTIVE